MKSLDFEPDLLAPVAPRKQPLPVPSSGVFDAPLVQVCVNAKWLAHVDGCLEALLENDAWTGTDGEIYEAIQQVMELLSTFDNYKDSCLMSVITDVTAEDCVIYKVVDGGEPVPVIDLADCVVPGPQGPPGEQGPVGPPGAAGATLYVRDPGSGQLQTSGNDVDWADVPNAHFLHINADNDPLTNTLDITPVTVDVPALRLNFASQPTVNPFQYIVNTVGRVFITPQGAILSTVSGNAISIGASGSPGVAISRSGVNSGIQSNVNNAIDLYFVSTVLHRFNNNGRGTFGGQIANPLWQVGAIIQDAAYVGVDVKGAASQSANLQNWRKSDNTVLANVTSDGRAEFGANDGGANTHPDVLNLYHESTASPLADFGVGLRFQGKSSTTAKQDMALLRAVWEEPTHATRKAQLVLSAFDTTEREVLRGGANGTEATFAAFGGALSPRVDVGVLDCLGNAAVKAALDALKAFNWIAGTINLGTVPEPPSSGKPNRCQIATALGPWIYEHTYKHASREAWYTDLLYLVDVRTDSVKKMVDVEVADAENLLGWVNTEWTDFTTAGSFDQEFHLSDMQTYFQSTEVRDAFFCSLNDDGFMDAVAWLGFIATITNTEDPHTPATYFYQFMRCFDQTSIAVWATQATWSQYIDPDADCSGIDCDNWMVTMDFTADDWANSVDLIEGVYDNVYRSEVSISNFLVLQIPFAITGGTITMYNQFSLPNDCCAVREIGGTAYEYFDHNAGGQETYTLANSYPGGMEIQLIRSGSTSDPDRESQIRSVTLTGTGTPPAPDA